MATPVPARFAIRRLAGGVAVVLVASLRCQVNLPVEPLQRFETCEALQLYLEDQILHPGVEASVTSTGVLEGCTDVAMGAPPSAPPPADEVPAREYTTTTTQEQGVDEPDFVKNDGDKIFVLRRGQMVILSAWPADAMTVLSRTAIDGTPFTMLFGDAEPGQPEQALVLSTTFTDRQRVVAHLFDVSDPGNPVALRTTAIDGAFQGARRVGDQVMLVTRAQLAVDVDLDGAPFSDDANRAALRSVGVERLLPAVSDFIVGVDAAPRVDKAAACEHTYAPRVSDGQSMLLAHTLSLRDPTTPLRATGVVAGFSYVYASPESLVLASVELNDGGYFTPNFNRTRLHKLAAFQGEGAAEYRATGVFDGIIRDEMSLDEQDGLLRMVITNEADSQDPSERSTSLLVIEESGTELVEVARVDDIGRGESVESVRFLGTKAYVVTYPRDLGDFVLDPVTGMPSVPFMDPLFVIDLADPKSPLLRGDLELGGYSAYLHPIDEGHLLAIGANTDASSGAYLGLSLIVFDVTNPDAPSVQHRYDFGGQESGSEALVDRHAFTYFPAERALAIPVQRFDSSDAILTSSALAVFRIDLEQGILPLGAIEQAGLLETTFGELTMWGGAQCASVRRSVMISDVAEGAFVYAVSAAGVVAAALEQDLPTVASVRIADQDDAPCDSLTGSL
ncbi:MAG: beta-propeller domain-containing protein [Deltaproteobacteria bacterium]|nr:beta-propeller domain-containing protein [Deltaproteobacteria bacterium]